MKRLTENVFGYTQLIACGNDFCKETCEKHDGEVGCGDCPIQKAIEKLAEYEDIEEQGFLMKLSRLLKNKKVEEMSTHRIWIDIDYDDIDKTVFLTQEEDEEALERMENKGGRIMRELNSAIKILTSEYEKAKKNGWIKNPIAYALFQTWKIFDK